MSGNTSIEDTAFSEDWGLRTHIVSKGKKLQVQHSPGWSISKDMGAFTAFTYLIREDVLLLKLKGDLKTSYVQDIYRLSRSVLNFSQKTKLYMVLDISEVPHFTVGVRKEFEKYEEVYSKYWLKTIIVHSLQGDTLISLYQLFKPIWAGQIVSAKSIHEAFEACTLVEPTAKEAFQVDKRLVLLEKAQEASKEELLAMYEKLLNEKEEETAFHKHRMAELFEMIGKTTWRDDFTPVSKNISEDDLYFDLFSAIYLLQNDLQDIVEEQQRQKVLLEADLEKQLLEKSQKKIVLRSIMEYSTDAIWLIDNSFRFIDFNSNYEDVFEKAHQVKPQVGDEVLRIPFQHLENIEFWKLKYEEALEGKFVNFLIREEHLLPKVFDISIFPISEGGKVESLACFMKDITSKVHGEEQLRKSRRQLQLLLEQIPAILFSLDSELKVSSMMGKGLEALGLKPNQLSGKHLSEFNKAFRLGDSVLEAHQNGLRGISGKYELTFAEREYLVYVEPIYEGRVQKVTGVLSLSIDITHIKKSEEQLRLQNKDLKKLNKELDKFVYSVSHDLRAPLASVSGLVALAKESDDLAQIREYLMLQEKSVTRLDAFIREIINLSRNSRMEIESGEVDFQKIVEEIFENQAFSEDGKNVEMLLNINSLETFYSDSRRIKVIIGNLVANSIRYSMPEKGQQKVKVSIISDDKNAVIRIVDNGIGIDSKFHEKIFDMFYRATQRKSGSGLGLYIVKETVDKLKGEIEVESELGVGAEFVVTIPNNSHR